MAAGMKIIIVTRSEFHSLQVIFHSQAGKIPQMFVSGAWIEGIGGMGKNPMDFMLFGIGKKSFYIREIQLFCTAAPGIAGKKLEGIGINFYGFLPHSQIAFGGG